MLKIPIQLRNFLRFLLSLMLILATRLLLVPKPTESKSWKRILILGDNHIGDVLYRTCSFAYIKRAFPHCDIYYITSDISNDVLSNNPYIKKSFNFARSDTRFDISLSNLVELYSYSFDVAFCTSHVSYWKELVLAIFLRIPNRIGFVHSGFGSLVTHPVHITCPQPLPHYFRDAVSQITGLTIPFIKPEIYCDNTNRNIANNLWNSLNIVKSYPTVAVFLTNRQPGGNVDKSIFGDVLNQLISKAKINILLLGSSADAHILHSVDSMFSLNAIILAGDLTIPQLSHFLSHVDLVFTADSGPRHIANASSIPCYFFRNLLFDASEAGVYCLNENDLFNITSSINVNTHVVSDYLFNEIFRTHSQPTPSNI